MLLSLSRLAVRDRVHEAMGLLTSLQGTLDRPGSPRTILDCT